MAQASSGACLKSKHERAPSTLSWCGRSPGHTVRTTGGHSPNHPPTHQKPTPSVTIRFIFVSHLKVWRPSSHQTNTDLDRFTKLMISVHRAGRYIPCFQNGARPTSEVSKIKSILPHQTLPPARNSAASPKLSRQHQRQFHSFKI